MIESFKGITPKISSSAYVHPSAIIIGDVEIGENVSIWPCAVLRGDMGKIIIGRGSNIQDGAILHTDHHGSTIIGERVTIGHGAIIHSAVIDDEVLIGMNATILAGVVKKGCIVGAQGLVMNSMILEEGLYAGIPVVLKRKQSEEGREGIRVNALRYQKLAKEYQK